ncbi:MAG: DUF488 family protein [Planctomycetes bacterium]|jgi:uncharacterized protein YeaO (DUF488 family)|nr:DUF488 family protein [Phycisphaerae bacterium]MBS0186601.1 DUF488 family protein [Planctomycetota bacterium]MCK6477984.1 DUF488 family protein [Phycisphaerales bacterium]QOJ01091.1 MAG: DUF488 family protein [Phycisphaeraceae bacterium]
MSTARDQVRLKRVYDDPEPGDGFRVLVDRLWPRGLTKSAARVDLWMKEVAPSTDLRRWYHADLTRWAEFRRRYRAELADRASPAHVALGELRALVLAHAPSPTRGGKGRAGKQGVTLVYGAKNAEQNHALVLREVLISRSASRG